jgi:hypothetical protein
MGDEVVFATASLSGAHGDDSIPFITTRVTTEAIPDSMMATYATTAFFSDTSTLRVERGTANAGGGQMTVEVTVIQFDPARVAVQSGVYDMGFGPSDTAALSPDVTLANTFLYHTFQGLGVSTDSRMYLTQGRITDVDELTFNNDGTSVGITGHWFTADATAGGDFTVQPVEITVAAAASTGTDSLTSIAENKTFLLGSYRQNEFAGHANEDHTIDVDLTSDVLVSLQRAGTGGDINWSGFAVTMTDATMVQRDTLVQSSADVSETVEITAVTNGWVHMAGSAGSLTGGSFAGTAAEDVPDAFCAWDFVDSDTIQVTKFTGGGEADNDLSWEVIDWAIGAGQPPARRVMVRG